MAPERLLPNAPKASQAERVMPDTA